MRVSRERLERSSWSRHGAMAHAPPGFVAKAIGDHFVVGEQGAVEKQHVRIGDAGVKVLRNTGAAGRIDEALTRRFHRDADGALADVVGRDISLFEPQRNLAGNREEFELHPRQRLEWFAETDCAARRNVAIDHVEHAISADRIERRLRAEQDERLALAQRQQARRGIDLGVGQNDGADRRMTPRALRVQRGGGQDLLTQIDRCVEQDPVCSVHSERDAHLRSRLDLVVAAPGEAANTAAAVPLRDAAARAGAQHERS